MYKTFRPVLELKEQDEIRGVEKDQGEDAE